jgi:hypothetical protein
MTPLPILQGEVVEREKQKPMAEQTGPAEVITLAEYWQRVKKGQTIDPGTLILLPVTTLQQTLEDLDKLEAILARQDMLAEQRRQIIDQGCRVFSDWTARITAGQNTETCVGLTHDVVPQV